MAEKWLKVGSVCKGKSTDDNPTPDNYIKIGNDVILKKGDIIRIQDPRKSLDAAVKAGRMDASKAAEYKKNIPDFVLKELVLPPRK